MDFDLRRGMRELGDDPGADGDLPIDAIIRRVHRRRVLRASALGSVGMGVIGAIVLIGVAVAPHQVAPPAAPVPTSTPRPTTPSPVASSPVPDDDPAPLPSTPPEASAGEPTADQVDKLDELDELAVQWQTLDDGCRDESTDTSLAACAARDELGKQIASATFEAYATAWTTNDDELMTALTSSESRPFMAHFMALTPVARPEPGCLAYVAYDPAVGSLSCLVEVEEYRDKAWMIVAAVAPDQDGRWRVTPGEIGIE
ncbi:hypothetical protein [Pengzhenrongella sicca]|uniref:Uncharacterized protein n=1 Tax=Pengzhenrongella sicca TaxID=2819238 RepID=A0A8A4ZFZ0_9MICO|nr:hypothetical protein [Pengzhenrongella sicca]QTE30940.1 hypothetical protein J4E96_08450 [Pengzhenrongella sicca]